MKKHFVLLLAVCFTSVLKAQDITTNPNNFATYSRYYDAPPRFPDKYQGDFFKYVANHLQFPKNVTQDISGQINIHAIIDTNGAVSDIKVIRSISKEVDQEVLYTIARSPRYQPAIYKGQKVPVFFAIVMDVSVNAGAGTITAKRDTLAQIKEMQMAKKSYDVKPMFPISSNNFYKYITDNIQYPKHVKADIHDMISIRFNIDTSGKITDIAIIKNVSKEVDQVILDVLDKAPKFKSATMNGKKVVVAAAIILDIDINTSKEIIIAKRHIIAPAPPLNKYSSAINNSNLQPENLKVGNKGKKAPNSKDTSIYSAVEIAPGYPGGEQAFNNYLQDHIVYPPYAKKNNVQGRVFISFVVEKNGELSNFKVMRTPSNDLADEAVRVLRSTNRWSPGLQNGKPVRVAYTVPINFSL